MMNVMSECVIVTNPGAACDHLGRRQKHRDQKTSTTPEVTCRQHNVLCIAWRKCVSVRASPAARWRGRLGVSIRKVEEQERSNDLLLSDLQHWQKALGVPLETNY